MHFKCKICGSSFKTKCHLKQHTSSVHDEEKPFQCNICAADFKRKGGLNHHIATIHEEIY